MSVSASFTNAVLRVRSLEMSVMKESLSISCRMSHTLRSFRHHPEVDLAFDDIACDIFERATRCKSMRLEPEEGVGRRRVELNEQNPGGLVHFASHLGPRQVVRWSIVSGRHNCHVCGGPRDGSGKGGRPDDCAGAEFARRHTIEVDDADD